jgi:hypothetical protein
MKGKKIKEKEKNENLQECLRNIFKKKEKRK